MTVPQLLDLSNPRYWRQNAQMAVRDIYDALVELITNADDRYIVLDRPGRIEIEVERRRKETPSILRVRDFADGMTLSVMKKKLARLGDRVSGMADGLKVRGSNSRGAKDVAVLGGVVFDSIAEDGRYHRCEISSRGYFTAAESSPRATPEHRESLGIPSGTGTVVTLQVNPDVASVPQHDTLKDQLASLVSLRDILSSNDRELILSDLNKARRDTVRPVKLEGRDVVKERLIVPGYPNAEAKLVVRRASRRLENAKTRFREGGILIKSSHAIHEATLFAPELEHDPHAAWFFGRLTCEFVDQLSNDYDDRFEKGLAPTQGNPLPIIDPMRKAGLTRDHPFVRALFREALKRLRPLVEAERKHQESKRAEIESQNTRRRLKALEKEATRFLDRYLTEDETARNPEDKTPDTQLRSKGFSLNPPFAQLVVGHSARFWLNVTQAAFPELSVGDPVALECATAEISCVNRMTPLEPHPSQEGILRALWLVKGEAVTAATEVRVRVASIVATSAIEVIASEQDRYTWVTAVTFDSKRYTIRTGSTRHVTVLAPYPDVVDKPTRLTLECSDPSFKTTGEPILQPRPAWGVAICRLRVSCDKANRKARLLAVVGGNRCEADIRSLEPLGSTIKIEVKNVDHVNQRYLWRGSVLEIAAKHPSLKRYLGPPDDFPGQEEKHFRVLLAEIVAEAVCSLLISKNAGIRPEEYQEYDWDAYYADYTKLLTEFLPIAHASQVSDP